MTPLEVPLFFSAQEAVPRRGEPVTVGLPWPEGAISDDARFALLGPDGQPQMLQTKVLDRWPDGSIRWCLFDFLATWDGRTYGSGYSLVVLDKPDSRPDVDSNNPIPMTAEVMIPGNNGGAIGIVFGAFPDHNTPLLRSSTTACGSLFGLAITISMDYYIMNNTVRITVQALNPCNSEHPDGNWDLGNKGSIWIPAMRAIVDRKDTTDQYKISIARNAPFDTADSIVLYQRSSGGVKWKSINHINHNLKVPLNHSGYILKLGNSISTGQRAVPTIISGNYSLTMTHFWENFPAEIIADDELLSFTMLAEDSELIEIQGGEQKTFVFTVGLSNDNITNGTMIWARSPITVTASPEWYARCGVMPYLTPKSSDPHTTYLALVDQAIEGPDTFYHKREKIDEYGWRHFGDIWGDHEAVFYPGPEPMVSHYNNQYDCVLGFLTQYLRSGDVRWLRFGLECADHTCDIDVYHTTKDKWAYNGGLFWHTYHYAPADTGTHRSYPKSLRSGQHFDGGQDLSKMGDTGAALKKNYAIGGGPSAAHNYNRGLMIAYYLTGKEMYKETAIGLADFVLNMDDGNRTVFRWLSRRDTGLSIQSSEGYLGPGRASANSLNAVLVGHQLTGDEKYLKKGEQIIYRVVHPRQKLESLDLLNAELRWFYVMFLQALGAYLDYKITLGQLDGHYAYARECLLHYARYMLEHERPILSQPEKLQYPTETWAAQDLRKVEVFQYAAKHSTGSEREKYLEKAEWFLQYCVKTLDEFPPTATGIPTKSLCRPVILCMNHGFSRSWWKQNPDAAAPPPKEPLKIDQLGEWQMYVPQKAVAIQRAKMFIKLGIAAVVLLSILVLMYCLFL